ncbi:hypothetical protein E2P81_ATG10645, partial [Venturia nashicola]
PEDDASGGDLYIRLPAQHRLRKVRGTIYVDPGNPFDEKFETPFLPSTIYGRDVNSDTDNSDALEHQSEIVQSFGRSQRDLNSMFSDPFDLVNLRDTPSNRESLSSSQSTRRSMSVDIGFLPTQRTTESTDISKIESMWPDHAPMLHIPHPSGTVFTMHKRDTKFYEFYDDLLMEYGVEKSIDATNYMQHTLPIRF